MPYAQINYPQIQGINGRYTIAQIGCFITSFCNLMERYGSTVDPAGMNAHFVNNGIYIDVDDGIRDDVGWGTISAYDNKMVVTGTGTGWPTTNNAIVRFAYKSPRTGGFTTHFCLMADHTNRTILDSYDGKVKSSGVYGTPTGWASYALNKPQPVPPPAAKAFTVENIEPRNQIAKVAATLWDLNQTTWPGMVNNPVMTLQPGTELTFRGIAHHSLGGKYYMTTTDQHQGYNVVDFADKPAPAPAPVPIPEPVVVPPPPAPEPVPPAHTEETKDGIKYEAWPTPKPMYITRTEGADKWDFKDAKSWRDFKSVKHYDFRHEVFIIGVAHHPIAPSGADYYMTVEDFGDFKNTGKVVNHHGFNWTDLSDTMPPMPAPDLPNWRDSYVPFSAPVRYVAMADYTVTDLDGTNKDVQLKKYDYIEISGTFQKDGQVFGRPTPAYTVGKWYGVPMLDTLLEKYDVLFNGDTTVASRQVTHTTRPGDYFVIGFANLRKFLDKIDDVWDDLFRLFKNKKGQK